MQARENKSACGLLGQAILQQKNAEKCAKNCKKKYKKCWKQNFEGEKNCKKDESQQEE